ncbi:MAG: 16S rRNA (uracil(1498)-N(3))-methyltransferase [Verrucomicrobiales bacterium]|jgi:16S rRNA (uracil1498-N3)-methyltransferase|nr:16S rRNA (uracil(1498)-N(3))-methyltransferase [Verrucomicrobiales bacterium]
MSRFYCPTISDGVLSREESHHVCKVLRLGVGDECEVFDGFGTVARVRLTQVNKHATRFVTISVNRQPAPDYRLILGQCLPKNKSWDFILQKATELGLHEIYPIAGEHSVTRADGAQPGKWRLTLIEACKQCGQNRAPLLHSVTDLRGFLDRVNVSGFKGLRLIASLQSDARLLSAVLAVAADREVLFLVGPEGDFGAEETRLAISAGFQPVTLGDLVLRVETATLFLTSVLTNHLRR